jgi:hypothetical protein
VLKLTAIIEAVTGLALMAVPCGVVRLLLGGEISGASIALGRVAGFGLLSLGNACWPRRDATGDPAAALIEISSLLRFEEMIDSTADRARKRLVPHDAWRDRSHSLPRPPYMWKHCCDLGESTPWLTRSKS